MTRTVYVLLDLPYAANALGPAMLFGKGRPRFFINGYHPADYNGPGKHERRYPTRADVDKSCIVRLYDHESLAVPPQHYRTHIHIAHDAAGIARNSHDSDRSIVVVVSGNADLVMLPNLCDALPGDVHVVPSWEDAVKLIEQSQ